MLQIDEAFVKVKLTYGYGNLEVFGEIFFAWRWLKKLLEGSLALGT